MLVYVVWSTLVYVVRSTLVCRLVYAVWSTLCRLLYDGRLSVHRDMLCNHIQPTLHNPPPCASRDWRISFVVSPRAETSPPSLIEIVGIGSVREWIQPTSPQRRCVIVAPCRHVAPNPAPQPSQYPSISRRDLLHHRFSACMILAPHTIRNRQPGAFRPAAAINMPYAVARRGSARAERRQRLFRQRRHSGISPKRKGAHLLYSTLLYPQTRVYCDGACAERLYPINAAALQHFYGRLPSLWGGLSRRPRPNQSRR